MALPAIPSTSFSKAPPPALPTHLDSKLWENLTGTLIGAWTSHSTIFKILGLITVLGLFYCAKRICSSRTKPINFGQMPPPTNSTSLKIKQEYLDQYQHFKFTPINNLPFAKEADTHSHRNRHPNVRPYQQNIFKFQDPSLYFNASCVLQGRAISCQGPLNYEHADFWRMVWESKTTAIVMLTDLDENSNRKCSWYLPKVNGEKLPLQPNFPQELEITVTQIAGPPQPTATSTRASIDERHLKLEYQGEKRTVVHYHLRGWGDFQAVPPDILAKLVMLVSESHFSKGEHILTHCSAGIGRSGTFLATLEAFTQLKNKPALTDLVFNTVQQLRSFAHRRVGMVQTVEQYGLIFKTLAVLDPVCAREFCVQAPLT